MIGFEIAESIKLFKDEDWFQPLLHFMNCAKITKSTVIDYLKKNDLKYEIEEYPSTPNNFIIKICPINKFDLCSIHKDDHRLYTNQIYNRVYNAAYFLKSHVNINIHDSYLDWIGGKNKDMSIYRQDKLIDLLSEKESNINHHIIRHIRQYVKSFSNHYINDVYDYYIKNEKLSDNQIETIKDILYRKKSLLI